MRTILLKNTRLIPIYSLETGGGEHFQYKYEHVCIFDFSYSYFTVTSNIAEYWLVPNLGTFISIVEILGCAPSKMFGY